MFTLISSHLGQCPAYSRCSIMSCERNKWFCIYTIHSFKTVFSYLCVLDSKDNLICYHHRMLLYFSRQSQNLKINISKVVSPLQKLQKITEITCLLKSRTQIFWLKFQHSFNIAGMTFNRLVAALGISVQFSRSVVSDSLRTHEPQHARPPCPSPTPGVYPNSCPLSRWCHLTVSSSVVPFSSCLQSFPTSGSFQMSQVFASGGQNISFSFNISPSNEQSGLIFFRMDWLDLLAVQGTLKSLLQHHSSKASILWYSAFSIVQLTSIHDYWKNHSLAYTNFLYLLIHMCCEKTKKKNQGIRFETVSITT